MPSGYVTSPVPIDNDDYKTIDQFVQVYSGANITAIKNDEFLSAPFHELCPSGDCIKDCQDMGRVFASVPSGIKADPLTYGRPDGDPKITLFGICTNLEQAAVITSTSMKKEYQEAAKYFQAKTYPDANITKATNKIATCFASTCDLTRESSKCKDACGIDNFLAGPSRLNFNFENNNTGSLACITRLCDNTCGLPYANTDVLGIGVLTTYYVQALGLMLLGIVFIISAGYQLWRKAKAQPTIKRYLKSPLETFLGVQTYFGISVAAAAFVMNPATVDSLNGYALLATAIMGFMPPVFCLMLLHSHGVKNWFSTCVVTISYLLNTIVFFMLTENLKNVKGNTRLLGVGLQDLFSTISCGGSSAMALCHQLVNAEPLMFLDEFFNQGPIPNIRTVPLLWAWTTIVLVCLVGGQIGSAISERLSGPPQALQRPGARAKSQGLFSSLAAILRLPIVTLSLLLLSTLLFCLALGYQFRVVREYQKMDVIDKYGWSFGQIVAVLFWLPPFFDACRSFFYSQHKAAGASDESEKHSILGYNPNKLSSTGSYSQLSPNFNNGNTAYKPETVQTVQYTSTPDTPPRVELNDRMYQYHPYEGR